MPNVFKESFAVALNQPEVDSITMYLCVRHSDLNGLPCAYTAWTASQDKALRFAREKDAEDFIDCYVRGQSVKVVKSYLE